MLHPHMCSTVVDMEQQSFPPSSSTIGSNLEQDENIISEFPPDVDVSQMDFQTIKAASDTMKKNSKIQFCQSDLLKLLSYLEGELQARDVVIAALKSERIKNLINVSRVKTVGLNDPQAALFRDNLASNGSYVSRQSSAAAAQSDIEMRQFARNQLDSLEDAIQQQRGVHFKLLSIIRDTENKHKGLIRELEEEKRKHERDTAQGDDITYGLEIERTRLRQDLETEKAARRRSEKDLKKAQEQLEQERSRQKQIVLLLLAERKKIIMKYIEERKRSEDLAQILSEEKQRVDTIAEGLEEESKKSLRMEAELEKQTQAFDAERKFLTSSLAKEEKRIKDQESEIAQLKAENEMIRKQALPQRLSSASAPVSQDEFQSSAGTSNAASSPMVSSVAIVIQPTATASSFPVSGPTTGIARSISPGQSLRQQQPLHSINSIDSTHSNVFSANKVTPRKLSNPSVLASSTVGQQQVSTGSTSQNNTAIQSNNINKAFGSVNTATSSHNTGRGVPPPIPPNKPVIPPKREPSTTRALNTVAAASGKTAANVAQPFVTASSKLVETCAITDDSQ